MTEIKLRNTRTRKKETFEPLDRSNVRMYVCGPTVYDRAHLGNARPVIVFDVLYRLLRHFYGAEHVTYIRNVTDVDDKINARAAESGRAISDITEETGRWFAEDTAALGVLPPDHEPRATAHIGDMTAMIERLIASGHAYEAEGHVLFSVASYPAYGQLSGRTVEDMIAGSRVEVAPYKRDPMDFVLWKPSGADEPGWESPWGRGRPGWHIECSAMSRAFLGESFDIHGGGNDLMFPHHENEIAQSACAHSEAEFARYWLHNEMLQVEGRKMAKSAGNFFTVRDLLDQGWPGEVIRFVFLGTHYGKPMDWTSERAEEARKLLRRWYRQIHHHADLEDVSSDNVRPEIVNLMADDLNTPGVLGELHKLVNSKASEREKYSQLANDLAFLGLLRAKDLDRMEAFWLEDNKPLDSAQQARINHLIQSRGNAKKLRDYAEADRIREKLEKAGIKLSDQSDGTHWEVSRDFDPKKLEGSE